MIKGSHDEIRAYMRKYINARYRRIMDEIIIYLGGKCVRCGLTKNLQADHIDRKTKLFNVSTGIQNYTKIKVWREVKKCQLLCKNCHRQKSIEVGDVIVSQHGSPSMYDKRRHGCRCDICREGNRNRSKEFKKRRKSRE